MDNELVAKGFKKVDLEVGFSFGGKVVAFDENKDAQYDPDLQYAKFIMCHEGANANGDFFTKEVLQQAQSTPKFKPIDWEHGQPMIGTMLDSQYKEDEQGRGYIEASGVIWKFIYPELSDAIKAKSASGELRLSMECYYKDADYRVGEMMYDQATAESLGITDFVGRQYMGQPVHRVFKEVLFGGVGVVANPADKEAIFLSVAKDLKARNQEVANFDRPTNDFRDKQVESEVVDAVIVSEIVKAFDKAKSVMVSLFNDNTLRSKDQLINEINDTLQALSEDIGLVSYKLDSEQLLFKGGNNMAKNSKADVTEKWINPVVDTVHDPEDFDNKEQADVSKKSINPVVETAGDDEEAEAKKADDMEDSEADVKQKFIDPVSEPAQDPEDFDEGKAKKGKPTKNDPDGDGDDDSTPEGDTDDDYAGKDKKKKAKKQKMQDQSDDLNDSEASLVEVLRQEIAELRSQLASMQSEKVAKARLAELAKAGISFTGTRLEKEVSKLGAMSNEAYADYKELLFEVASVKAEMQKVEASEMESEEVVVEGVEHASAGLNVEVEIPKAIKPFGHLSR